MELDIDNFDMTTVKLAGKQSHVCREISSVECLPPLSILTDLFLLSSGLLHDVGHGPFSHLFESEFLPRVLEGSKW